MFYFRKCLWTFELSLSTHLIYISRFFLIYSKYKRSADSKLALYYSNVRLTEMCPFAFWRPFLSVNVSFFSTYEHHICLNIFNFVRLLLNKMHFSAILLISFTSKSLRICFKIFKKFDQWPLRHFKRRRRHCIMSLHFNMSYNALFIKKFCYINDRLELLTFYLISFYSNSIFRAIFISLCWF